MREAQEGRRCYLTQANDALPDFDPDRPAAAVYGRGVRKSATDAAAHLRFGADRPRVPYPRLPLPADQPASHRDLRYPSRIIWALSSVTACRRWPTGQGIVDFITRHRRSRNRDRVAGQRADQTEERSWITYGIPWQRSVGDIVGVNVAAEEITERKRAELAFRRANGNSIRLRIPFRNSSGWPMHGRHLLVQQSLVRIHRGRPGGGSNDWHRLAERCMARPLDGGPAD